MEQIIKQAPDSISNEYLQEIYIKNNSNVIDTLVELWDIKEKKKEITKEQKKWNDIRETCDFFDNEMYKQIKNTNKSIENIPLKNVPIASCNILDASCDIPDNSCNCTCTHDNDVNNLE